MGNKKLLTGGGSSRSYGSGSYRDPLLQNQVCFSISQFPYKPFLFLTSMSMIGEAS